MSRFDERLGVVVNMLNTISLIASVMLLGAISLEVRHGDHLAFSVWYKRLQFGVCMVFFLTAAIRLSVAEIRRRYLWRDIIFVIGSVPYINILEWTGIILPREAMRIIAFTPILISIMATTVIIEWLIDGRTRRLMAAYVLTVLLFTYISALVFYDYEIGVNPALHSFGDALWWAWMNVTTVGAPIFPVTAIGKVVCVSLPVVGMMFFPIFTVYVSNYYDRRSE
ncbi:MAG: two pore domain potassium channel family protein [Alistipes sp.]|jgi:voltage-gated potassium channel|nr:two pore domain potassium channel family protein [Alistipes sp.]